MTTCNCPLCQKSTHNPADYYVDISELDNPRPVGVSGLMRVRNEEQFVAASIDSCIDALDELIICYQECTDRTPEILELKRQQYPNKIKLYFYAPHIYTSNLSQQQYEYAYALPDHSPHLLSNYYNYALSKSSYSYAMKIDADQLYFGQRLKLYCDAYRSPGGSKPSLREHIAGRLSYNNSIRYCIYPSLIFANLCAPLLERSGSFMRYYEGYILKRIANEKPMLTMSGINVCRNDDTLGVPYNLDPHQRIFSSNGDHDHLIFRVSSQTYYYPFRNFRHPSGSLISRILIESFHRDKGIMLQGAFMWHHLRFFGNKNLRKFNIIPYTDFRAASPSKLKKLKQLSIIKFMQRPILLLLKYDRNYPDFGQQKRSLGV